MIMRITDSNLSMVAQYMRDNDNMTGIIYTAYNFQKKNAFQQIFKETSDILHMTYMESDGSDMIDFPNGSHIVIVCATKRGTELRARSNMDVVMYSPSLTKDAEIIGNILCNAKGYDGYWHQYEDIIFDELPDPKGTPILNPTQMAEIIDTIAIDVTTGAFSGGRDSRQSFKDYCRYYHIELYDGNKQAKSIGKVLSELVELWDGIKKVNQNEPLD